MEEIIKEDEDRRSYVTKRIGKLRADVAALENKLSSGDNDYHNDFLATEPSELEKGDESLREKYQPAKLSELLELTVQLTGCKLEAFSRKLRFNPGELFLYDCFLEGRTSSLKFLVKFVETVKGPGGECGEISSLEAEIMMSKGDPESLSDWISECCNMGDLAMLIHGLVEFTDLANNRRSILRSLYRRGKSGNLGSCSFSIIGEGDGVMVVGVGPKNVNLFSINWKIEYCHAMKSMKSNFTVDLREEDLRYESAEVFAALQRPYLSEEDLPLLWDAVADTLTSCS